jgi:radical SAM protein with 4Fe4S-binding SPASM domain
MGKKGYELLMEKLQKLYMEISNICNLQCSFCPEVERPKKIMSVDRIESLFQQSKSVAHQVCLHLMGEPFGHPQFQEILEAALRNKIRLNLTTNGTLISRLNLDAPYMACLEQINFSLQSYPDNFPAKSINDYLSPIFSFVDKALVQHPQLYINFRLWNVGSALNGSPIIEAIEKHFEVQINPNVDVAWKKSKKIKGKLYLNFDSRFTWPSLDQPNFGGHGTCHALKHHVGIHADGTVVPCCLDKEAVINLGNIFETSLTEILNSAQARELRQGFDRGELIHELCRHCQFATRFKKKVITPVKQAAEHLTF